MMEAQRVRLFNRLFPIPSRWKNVLYVHVPFCIKRCHFCVYFSKVPERRGEIDDFLEQYLFRQVDAYRRIFDVARFDEVYFGGGTPTILSPTQLDRVFGRIPGFEGIPLKACEASPKTIRKEHVDVLAAHGFTYVSLGVQTRSRAILEAQNREVPDEIHLVDIIRSIEDAGMIANVDLIFFLQTGGLADLAQAREDLLWVTSELRPTSITVHSEYNAAKSLAKQRGVCDLLRQAGEYICTNSLLEESEFQTDMNLGAEYRLMRRRHDFAFYLIGSRPSALRFGHNVLAVGEYDRFRLRTNYLQVSDFYPQQLAWQILDEARRNEQTLARTRARLGLSPAVDTPWDRFFAGEEDARRFDEVLALEGLLDLGKGVAVGVAR